MFKTRDLAKKYNASIYIFKVLYVPRAEEEGIISSSLPSQASQREGDDTTTTPSTAPAEESGRKTRPIARVAPIIRRPVQAGQRRRRLEEEEREASEPPLREYI